MNKAFVVDTYAIIEIIRGNKNYGPYLDSEIVINDFIFAELCYNLIKEKGLEKSSWLMEKYSKFIMEINPKIVINAMLFRFENRKRDVSMADCISYMQAKDLNVGLLTGDKEFMDMPGVEFVK